MSIVEDPIPKSQPTQFNFTDQQLDLTLYTMAARPDFAKSVVASAQGGNERDVALLSELQKRRGVKITINSDAPTSSQ